MASFASIVSTIDSKAATTEHKEELRWFLDSEARDRLMPKWQAFRDLVGALFSNPPNSSVELGTFQTWAFNNVLSYVQDWSLGDVPDCYMGQGYPG